ncbi:O-fucosyltransferase family protein [Neptunitalea lumnitzerae]|uniref:hypothetical protein n=1 Tax=Neptunitalea lumnitzerae TaxID=2965509 RepID=UPI00248FADAA|nr:hypothetical protein [Neptunitalea sp. Y10]
MRRKVWSTLGSRLRGTNLYGYLYKSYWHSVFNKSNENNDGETTCYLSAVPNPGAGIGHQLANWIAGYWWAKQFGLKFAHIPFGSDSWEHVLGFGEGDVTLTQLKKEGYKVRKLPLFDEDRPNEVSNIKRIISSYKGNKVVFLCEQDQFYKNQYGVIKDIQNKFFNAPARAEDKLIFDDNNYNIAIHVRRGDIMTDPSNPNLAMRYISNDYFEKVLSNVLHHVVKTNKPVHIYFFSQGKVSDFQEFEKFENLHWCLDMGAKDSFLHMVYADALITSKSSFSYKPALLNKGIKVCPENFWHSYPKSKDWVLVNDNGDFIS